MVPILMNKDVFEPSYSDLKFSSKPRLLLHQPNKPLPNLPSLNNNWLLGLQLCELTRMSGSCSRSVSWSCSLIPCQLGATVAPGLSGPNIFCGVHSTGHRNRGSAGLLTYMSLSAWLWPSPAWWLGLRSTTAVRAFPGAGSRSCQASEGLCLELQQQDSAATDGWKQPRAHPDSQGVVK